MRWPTIVAVAIACAVFLHLTDRVIAGLTASPCEINMPEGD